MLRIKSIFRPHHQYNDSVYTKLIVKKFKCQVYRMYYPFIFDIIINGGVPALQDITKIVKESENYLRETDFGIGNGNVNGNVIGVDDFSITDYNCYVEPSLGLGDVYISGTLSYKMLIHGSALLSAINLYQDDHNVLEIS
jgi:hypothetical protein